MYVTDNLFAKRDREMARFVQLYNLSLLEFENGFWQKTPMGLQVYGKFVLKRVFV